VTADPAAAGGSPGDARPKVLVGIRVEMMVSGETDLPPGYSGWIVKLKHAQELPYSKWLVSICLIQEFMVDSIIGVVVYGTQYQE
jgi:hypothetical protein